MGMGPIHLAVHGASGRMGQALLRAVHEQPDLRVSAALVRPGSGLVERPLREVLGADVPDLEFSSALDPDAPVDVLIDFSGPHAFDAALALAVQRRAAFVSGTTGLGTSQREALERAAAVVPVLWASNFSLGVALLLRFARSAAQALADWDCEIVEMHHRRKLDAPSGTALSLGEAVAFPGLNSFFADRGEEAWHTAAARALIAERAHAPLPLVLVTHQVNITALSGVFPASGEIIVMRLDGATLSLAGRIRTD